ncbi:hypothetical protein OMAG_002576 [Candidatus Omnitrophus magneticus]|uniref:Uncharacterized protein n=1 Tax=Candidatus Omnitrophus magneticus TaxID=1609969 RepID=A0A0F0CJZ4_9BACT|nr:hypothetical protein OMAG_002576 [Candidatus Omnitrophus magneticus]
MTEWKTRMTRTIIKRLVNTYYPLSDYKSFTGQDWTFWGYICK